MSAKLPSLFVSHGAPTLPLETADPTHVFLRRLGTSIGRPQAILMVSAHWDTPVATVTTAAQPATIHDFYGFPPELYALRYAAPGAPALAHDVMGLLQAAGISARSDAERGLDHGAWVPLTLMYPAADIPVVQLSLQTPAGATHHLRIGEALRPLRERGVLLIGSGGATHNLREFFRPSAGGDFSYAAEFTDWLAKTLEDRDLDSLVHYRGLAPSAVRAHPSEEHLLPLFAAVGAGGTSAMRLHKSMTGSLAMDAYQFAD
jgi:4,5-DOPA dioxygenase extradiol